MKKLRIGILGASRGMDFAMRILLDYEFAELAAVCEFYEPLARKTEAFFRERGMRIPCYSDYTEFLDRAQPDAVIVANYANDHAPYAICALLRGIHVFSEVQPVQTLAEAVELCEAAESTGAVYAYAENYCYFDTSFAMRESCLRGDIGEPVCLEGTFINDCSPKWDILTRGRRDHWRNYVPSTFYCTHSIGPMLFSTGLRAVRVNGLEMPRMDYMAENGARSGSAAMEVMELNNGGIARSLNGNLRRPYEASWRLIGSEGTIECGTEGVRLFRHTSGFGYDIRQADVSYRDFPFRPGGDLGCIPNADLASFGCFVGKILGDADCAAKSIDVYAALDMALPGLLAFRSILDGCAPYTVPDMRDPAVREAYRNDRFCTDPGTPEVFRLPTGKAGTPEVDGSVYDAVKARFAARDLTPGGK